MTNMTREEKIKVLHKLGAQEEDIDALLTYTENAFKPCDVEDDELFLRNFSEIEEKAKNICEVPPQLEIFESAAGKIPVISTKNTADFENMVRDIIFKGREVPHIGSMGASFAHGKTQRFIILSNKPYSGIPAADMGIGIAELEEAEWKEKSMIIRKYHECAHYYTKKFLSSARNNLHDELIADFCGLYAAFSEYKAEWFLKFMEKRFAIYTANLSPAAASVIKKLAECAAGWVEQWAKTSAFLKMSDAERIEYLANKDLLSITE